MKNLTGIAICKTRKAVGLTRENLAKLCGISQHYMGLIERGLVIPADYIMDSILVYVGTWIILKYYLRGNS